MFSGLVRSYVVFHGLVLEFLYPIGTLLSSVGETPLVLSGIIWGLYWGGVLG